MIDEEPDGEVQLLLVALDSYARSGSASIQELDIVNSVTSFIQQGKKFNIDELKAADKIQLWFLRDVLHAYRFHCDLEDLELLNKLIQTIDRFYPVPVEMDTSQVDPMYPTILMEQEVKLETLKNLFPNYDFVDCKDANMALTRLIVQVHENKFSLPRSVSTRLNSFLIASHSYLRTCQVLATLCANDTADKCFEYYKERKETLENKRKNVLNERNQLIQEFKSLKFVRKSMKVHQYSEYLAGLGKAIKRPALILFPVILLCTFAVKYKSSSLYAFAFVGSCAAIGAYCFDLTGKISSIFRSTLPSQRPSILDIQQTATVNKREDIQQTAIANLTEKLIDSSVYGPGLKLVDTVLEEADKMVQVIANSGDSKMHVIFNAKSVSNENDKEQVLYSANRLVEISKIGQILCVDSTT